MKQKSIKKMILCSLAIVLSTSGAFTQDSALTQGLSLKLSPGALLFYGDMSQDDYNPFIKYPNSSKFGIGFGIIKQFKPYLGIQAQLVTGNLYSKYEVADNPSASTYFSGSLTDFSISARFDPIYLFKFKNYGFSPYLSVGIATVAYRSVRRLVESNTVILPTFGYEDDGVTKSARQIAMSVPMAVGLSYQISPAFQVELEHSLRLTNTDLLDCLKGSTEMNDFYGFTSLGIRYTIGASLAPSKHQAKTGKSVKAVSTEPVKVVEPAVVKTLPVTNLFVDCQVPEAIENGQSFNVRIRINKSDYKGPAKLIQKFSDGFTAKDPLMGSGIFSFVNQSVIIEWDHMPADSILVLTYIVDLAKTVTGSQTISGRMEYQQPDGSKTVYFNKTLFVNAAKQVEAPAVVKTVETAGNIQKAHVVQGIEFRIQCGAFRDNRQAPSELAAKYGINELIQEEYIDGWYKYTVGSFKTYEEAGQFRDAFIKRTKILSAFIVAYRDGKRLANINEALR
ncbi:MAG: DUF6089 family protein [Bacteroidota bacterium]